MSISTTGSTGATGPAGETAPTGPTGPAGTPGRPAADLARLLHRRPDTVHRVATAFGEAHVFFPEADAERCTAVLLAEPDPEAPGRGRRGKGRPPAVPDAHVGDRPYAASSVFAAVLRTVFRQPLAQLPGSSGSLGSSGSPATSDSPDSAGDEVLPLEIELPVVRADREPGPAPGGVDGAELARRLFEPLGWRVEAAELPLDAEAALGGSPYLRLGLAAPAVRPVEALRQLSALLPVLDGAAHHWVPPERADVDGLLAAHPERAVIARRLARHGHAVAWGEEEEDDRVGAAAVRAALGTVGAGRVVHLGCGNGELLAGLLADGGFTELLGVDVSPAALAAAARRLGLERTADPAPEWESGSGAGRPRVRLVQGAPVYADARLTGFDAMVFEAAAVAPAVATPGPPAATGTTDRVTPAAHPAYREHAVFGAARPPVVVATAPPGADGAAFAAWAHRTAAGHGYAVTLPSVPRPPLLALFERAAPAPGGGGPR
ncbi:hypothetical protein ACW14Y_15465 [Kitasatospora sp. cg17-2]